MTRLNAKFSPKLAKYISTLCQKRPFFNKQKKLDWFLIVLATGLSIILELFWNLAVFTTDHADPRNREG